MRTILNLVIGGLVLWAASRLFPATVQINGTGTLILATVLIWVVSFAVALICILIAGIGAVFENWIWIIIGIILVFFSDIIAMTILSKNLDGFMVVGFWPKVLLSICFALFHLRAPSSDNN